MWSKYNLASNICTSVHPRISNIPNVCTPKNFKHFNNTNCMPMNFQCKHTHDYNDVLFHIFADRLMPSPRGVKPEHTMHKALILFIKENTEQVKLIAEPFLKRKKLSLDAYIALMEQPGHCGDELALHLLAVMNKIHYCIITKTQVYYSHPTVFLSPSAVHITLSWK